MPMARTLKGAFFKEWSPTMAYVLGYFAADGSMLKNKRGAHFIEFTSVDRVLLSNVCTATGSNHKIQKRERKESRQWKPQYRLQIGSKEWFSDLIRLGFMQRKSKFLQLPSIPTRCVSHFVRGYFDGDGCVYFNRLKYADRTYKRWVLMTLFTSGSKSFLQFLWRLLKKHGVSGGSLKKKNRGFELVFSHKDSLALYRLMYHTAPTSDLFLPRKRKKLERAVRVLHLENVRS